MAFNFVSPGAEAAQAIRAEMLLRQQLEREAEEMALRQAAEERQSRALEESIRANRTSADLSKQQFDYGRARDIVDRAGGTEKATPDVEALLKQAGFGGRLETREGQLGAKSAPMTTMAPGAVGAAAEAPMVPGVVFSQQKDAGTYVKPGFQYEQARQTAEERKQLAEIAAAERAKRDAEARGDRLAAQQADRELRALIAQTNANIAAGNLAVRQDAEARQQADDAREIKATEEAKENARIAMLSWGETMLGTIDRLIDVNKQGATLKNPDVIGPLQGSKLNPQQYTEAGQNFRADLDFVRDGLTISKLAELKQQSRTGATGFGALSERELSVIENAASKLRNMKQGDAAYAAELRRIRDTIMGTMKQQGGVDASQSSTPDAEGWITMSNGVRIRELGN